MWLEPWPPGWEISFEVGIRALRDVSLNEGEGGGKYEDEGGGENFAYVILDSGLKYGPQSWDRGLKAGVRPKRLEF